MMKDKQEHQYINVLCKDCNKTYLKRRDSTIGWAGRCMKCSRKYNANLPEIKKKASERARIQVLKQGGIPNARKFDGSIKGEKHPNWQGGITEERSEIFDTPEYSNWRRSVLIRDDYICQECGVKHTHIRIVVAHHKKLWRDFPELRYDIDNGLTLCRSCHMKLHRTLGATVAP